MGSNLGPIARFSLKLLLIVFIVFLCDRIAGELLQVFYFRQEAGVNYRTTYSIDSTNAEIIILGSSRASHHYVPDVFEEKLHGTCYNAGCDGTSILYDHAVFKAITKRYSPEYIIVDITPHSLEYNLADYDRLSVLSPYYSKNDVIKSIVDLKGPFEKFKYLSAVYPFNSLVIQIAMGNFEVYKQRNQGSRGYIPLYDVKGPEEIDTLRVAARGLDSNKMEAIRDMISTCRQKNICLIFVYSPMYHIISDRYHSDIVYNICSENGIRYFDMSNSPEFIKNHDYFSDGSHLNDEGARIFTAMLSEMIRQSE